MYRFGLTVALFATTAAAAPLGAQQGGGARGNDDIPAAYRPPAGMCRIWIEGVPPAQQPAPTDCPTAVRNRPSNGRVVFGEKSPEGRSKDLLTKWKLGGEREVEPGRLTRGEGSKEEGKGEDRRRGGEGSETPVSQPSQPFPEMVAAVQFTNGQRPADVGRWLGEAKATARYTDADSDGRPEHVTWVDGAGQLVQIWTDRDRDGRADRVQMFHNGRRVRVYQQ